MLVSETCLLRMDEEGQRRKRGWREGCLSSRREGVIDEEEVNRESKNRQTTGLTEGKKKVIGCDGIRSRIRQVLLGEDNPAAHATYTHRYCFRALVPAAEALRTVPEYRVSTRFMYNGPDAHAITYPVADGALLNVLLVVSDPGAWPDRTRHTGRGTKDEARAAVAGWHPTARAVADLFPEDDGNGGLEKWAIFDMGDHPAPAYHSRAGRVCVAGDAAHAVGPHLGAGAGFGMEDALVLAELMDAVDRDTATITTTTSNGSVGGGDDADGARQKHQQKKAQLCRKALAAYNNSRYERTQWLAGATRDAVDLFQHRYEGVGGEFEKFGEEITWRFHKIWEYDVDVMVTEALAELRR